MSQTKQTSSKMQLTYFDIRGRGEFARLILAAKGQEYEDKRLQFSEWSAYKEKTLLGFLPVLKDGDKEISQTMSIVRHLGRKFDMYGKKDSFEPTQVDMLLDTIADLIALRMKVFGEQDEDKKNKMIEAIKAEGYKAHFDSITKLIKLNKGKDGWAVGSALSIADLVLFHAIDLNGVADKVTEKEYPELAANRAKVSSHPTISEYLKKRKPSPV